MYVSGPFIQHAPYPGTEAYRWGVNGVEDAQAKVRKLVDGKVAGIAVHTGARIASLAAPGEVLVSSTVKDLVAGSGLAFQEHGLEDLKGIPGEWRLYAVEQA